MQKDFDTWNNTKKQINELNQSHLFFNEGDIWWCHFGANVGLEQDGKGNMFMRPVLVFKKFSRNLCWVIPLSTKVSYGTFFFPLLSKNNIIRMAILPQLKLIDVKRLRDKMDSISFQELNFVKEKITAFIQ